VSTLQTPTDDLELGGEVPPAEIDGRREPSGPRSRNTTIAAALTAITGAGFFVWAMTWMLWGLGQDGAGPVVIGSIAIMGMGAICVVMGALLFNRTWWAQQGTIAVHAANLVAVTVFGALSAVASAAGADQWITTVVLMALFGGLIALLLTNQVSEDFPSESGSSLGRTVALWSIVGVWSLPTIGLFLSSFRAEEAVKTEGWWTIFTNPQLTLDNYTTVLESGGQASPNMWEHFLNSLAIVLPATVIPISIALFAAYAFAWMEFPGRKWIFVGVVSLMAVPLQMSLIPLLQLYTGGAHIGSFTIFPDLDLNGKALSVWLTHTGFGLPLAIFLLYNYVAGLPKDIFEAARIDGADHYKIFWKLVVPLSVPALAAFGIFQFLWTWNDYLIALTFLGSNADAHPLTIRLANLSGGRGQDWHVLTAAAFVTMSVPLVVFFSLQKYFVRGLLAGSVKG